MRSLYMLYFLNLAVFANDINLVPSFFWLVTDHEMNKTDAQRLFFEVDVEWHMPFECLRSCQLDFED